MRNSKAAATAKSLSGRMLLGFTLLLWMAWWDPALADVSVDFTPATLDFGQVARCPGDNAVSISDRGNDACQISSGTLDPVPIKVFPRAADVGRWLLLSPGEHTTVAVMPGKTTNESYGLKSGKAL